MGSEKSGIVFIYW